MHGSSTYFGMLTLGLVLVLGLFILYVYGV